MILVATVYVVYFYGPTLRKRSPFAQKLLHERADIHASMEHNK